MRGTVVGEKPVSQAQTKEYDEGHDRTFGERKRETGHFVWDKIQKKFVRAEERQDEPERALDAPIMSGRFYEGTSIPVCHEDGSIEQRDIGSRQRYQEHMRRENVTHASDYTETWKKDAERRASFFSKDGGDAREKKERREAVARAVYEVLDRGGKRRKER